MRDRSRPFHADQEGRRQEIGLPGDAALAHCPMPGPPPRRRVLTPERPIGPPSQPPLGPLGTQKVRRYAPEERDLHASRKTAAAHERPTAAAFCKRRRPASTVRDARSTYMEANRLGRGHPL